MATMADKKKTWVCEHCPQELVVYVNLSASPTHHCPKPSSSKVKQFHLKGESNE